MTHDFEVQKQETFWVWSDISTRNPNLPDKINLDIQFLETSTNSDKDSFKASLEEAGFSVVFYEEDGTIEASVNMIDASAGAVWSHEKRATKLALIHGFKPDGWGFFTNYSLRFAWAQADLNQLGPKTVFGAGSIITKRPFFI